MFISYRDVLFVSSTSEPVTVEDDEEAKYLDTLDDSSGVEVEIDGKNVEISDDFSSKTVVEEDDF